MIELACGDHGNDKIVKMAKEIDNGKCLTWTGISDLLAIDDAPSGILNTIFLLLQNNRAYILYLNKNRKEIKRTNHKSKSLIFNF